jgi:hypothetical protein
MTLLPPPGPERTRQLVLLGVLVVVAAGALWYSWPRTPTVPGIVASNPAVAGGPGNLGALPEPLKLASLERNDPAPAVDRNLFRFGQPPAPPPPPPLPPTPRLPAGPPVERTSGPPPIPLRLVAMWSAKGARWVSLSDPVSKDTFQATEGMVVDGRYKLVTVQERSVIMTYLDGTGQRTIPLTGG